MKTETNTGKREMRRRLAAVLVAIVFVLGTVFVPSQIHAVEPDGQDAAAPEVAAEDIVVTDEAADEETDEATGEGADVSEPETAPEETAEAGDTVDRDGDNTAADLSDLVVVTDENGNSMDISEIDESQYDGFLYKLEDDTTKAEVREMKEAIGELGEDQEVEEVVSNELYAADSVETISEVVGPEKIEYIEPNYILHAFDYNYSDDPAYESYTWQLTNTNVPDVWDKGMFGSGAVVAVLDSGVNMDRPDLKDASFVKQYNVRTGTKDVTDKCYNGKGHGTCVAGIIAETHNNSIGFTGAMPETTIMPVTVLDDEGKADIGTIILGINYAVSNGADVINMSFGGPVGGAVSMTLENEFSVQAFSQNPINYPASFICVVSVGSVDKNNNWSYFSNYNYGLTVVAPGEKVCVLRYQNSYGSGSGTSFAAPQVSALAAMVKSMDKTVSCAGFMELLEITSFDLGPGGYDMKYGYGLIDFSRAYRYMMGDMTMYRAWLSASAYAYDGKAKTPSVSVSRAGRIIAPGNYVTTYSDGRTAVGTYNVTITGTGSFTGTRTFSFDIVPPLVKGIKSPKKQKKKLTVRWGSMSKKQKKKYKSAISGYQVRVSTSSSFAEAKYVNVKGITKTKATVKNLKKKTTYYVQYRSYKTTGSGTYYSKWSAKKKARTK